MSGAGSLVPSPRGCPPSAMPGRASFGVHLTDAQIAATQRHPLCRHVRRLSRIRRAVPALQRAPMSQVHEWGNGMSFVRDLDDGTSDVVVGSAIGRDQDIRVDGVRNGTYRDCVTGGTIRVTGGRLSFHVRANSAGIWVLDGPGKVGDDGDWLREGAASAVRGRNDLSKSPLIPSPDLSPRERTLARDRPLPDQVRAPCPLSLSPHRGWLETGRRPAFRQAP